MLFSHPVSFIPLWMCLPIGESPASVLLLLTRTLRTTDSRNKTFLNRWLPWLLSCYIYSLWVWFNYVFSTLFCRLCMAFLFFFILNPSLFRTDVPVWPLAMYQGTVGHSSYSWSFAYMANTASVLPWPTIVYYCPFMLDDTFRYDPSWTVVV